MAETYCDYCERSIYYLERQYTTCDQCQMKACNRCYGSGLIPIYYKKTSGQRSVQDQKVQCRKCYLTQYTNKNYWY